MYKLFLFLALILTLACSQKKETNNQTIKINKDEVIWTGVIRDGYLMPINGNYEMDFAKDNKGNQLQPVILTSAGRYGWMKNLSGLL